MAIEIVSFPTNSMVIFQFAMLNYQRVIHALSGSFMLGKPSMAIGYCFATTRPAPQRPFFFVVKRSRTWTWRATSCGNLETLPQMECFLSAIVSVDIILIMWVN